jgi:hypothetical protein
MKYHGYSVIFHGKNSNWQNSALTKIRKNQKFVPKTCLIVQRTFVFVQLCRLSILRRLFGMPVAVILISSNTFLFFTTESTENTEIIILINSCSAPSLKSRSKIDQLGRIACFPPPCKGNTSQPAATRRVSPARTIAL